MVAWFVSLKLQYQLEQELDRVESRRRPGQERGGRQTSKLPSGIVKDAGHVCAQLSSRVLLLTGSGSEKLSYQ